MVNTVYGLLVGAVLALTPPEHAEIPFVEPVLMRVTCYTPTGNPTASGVMPYEGGCAARRDLIDKVAVVYDKDMRLVGYFEINDTGGHARIRNGSSIDIYRDNIDRARAWVKEYGDYMYVQIMEASG